MILFQDFLPASPSPVLPGGVVVGLVPVGAVGEGEVVAEVPPAAHRCHQAENCEELILHRENLEQKYRTIRCLQEGFLSSKLIREMQT